MAEATLVALLCAFFCRSIPFFRYGFHAGITNSRWGRTYVVYNFFHFSLSRVTNALFNCPNMLFSLVTWSLYFKSEDTWIPKSRLESVLSVVIRLSDL